MSVTLRGHHGPVVSPLFLSNHITRCHRVSVYVRLPPTSPVKFNGREWGAVAVELVLTEEGLLMKMKTNVKAGQNNNFLSQASALAVVVGGGPVVIQQSIQVAAIQNQ
jgi:hypothetical protein